MIYHHWWQMASDDLIQNGWWFNGYITLSVWKETQKWNNQGKSQWTVMLNAWRFFDRFKPNHSLTDYIKYLIKMYSLIILTWTIPKLKQEHNTPRYLVALQQMPGHSKHQSSLMCRRRRMTQMCFCISPSDCTLCFCTRLRHHGNWLPANPVRMRSYTIQDYLCTFQSFYMDYLCIR